MNVMNRVTRMLLALMAIVAMSVLVAPSAEAHNTRPCITGGEFAHATIGMPRWRVSRMFDTWGVQEARSMVKPGYIAHYYRRCDKQPDAFLAYHRGPAGVWRVIGRGWTGWRPTRAG